MRFLENLDYLLTIHKLSRAELARQIDIAPSTINAWYTKDYKGISLKNLVKLSHFFNVTIEDLVYSENISLIFTSKEFTESELMAIKNFADYIKMTRNLGRINRSRDNE